MNIPQNPFFNFLEFLKKTGFEIENQFLKQDLPFVLSTSGKEGPNARVLLLKQIEDEKLIFFSHINSQKGHEIKENPLVHLCFFFQEKALQIRIKGKCSILPHIYAQKYFQTRERLSKAGAIISKQSQELQNYKNFITEVKNIANSEDELKCPETWVAFAVEPTEFEFWEGSEFRLHLRTKYKKDLNSKNLWFSCLLYP